MKIYKRQFTESMLAVGDKVRVLRGKYKNFVGVVTMDENQFMPGWIEVYFIDKAKKGINTNTDMRVTEVEKI